MNKGRNEVSLEVDILPLQLLIDRREHSVVIFSSSPFVGDWKIKKQTKNNNTMHIYLKKLLFSHILQLKACVSSLFLHIHGEVR